jgi:hypothetical protein
LQKRDSRSGYEKRNEIQHLPGDTGDDCDDAACRAGGAQTMPSRSTSPPLMPPGLHSPSPAGSTPRVTSLASTVPEPPPLASCLTRAASPRLLCPAPHSPGAAFTRPRGIKRRVTSSASTVPGGSLMASCSTRRAASPPSMSLMPQSPWRWVSTLRVTSLASMLLGVHSRLPAREGRQLHDH